MEANSLVPKLRFKEFSNDWSITTLKNFFSIFNGYAFKSSDATHKGCRWIKIADIGINEIKDECISYLPKDFSAKYPKFVLNDGDLVLALTRPILNKKLKIASLGNLHKGALLNQRVGKINTNNNIDYVRQKLQSFKLISQIEARIAGTDPPNLSPNEINSIKITIPSLTEQNKIASFLTSVDKKINLLTKNKALFETYKKGVMQKIFSQEIRFKDEDGKDYPDWEERTLGGIGETFNGLTGKTKEDFGKGKPFIQYMQIFNSSKIDTSRFGYVDIKEGENQKKVKLGDIFFTTSSETPMEIGYASVLTEEVKDVYLNSFCFGYRPNSLNELNPDFASYLFRSDSFRKQIIKLAQGSTRYNMSKVQLMKLLVQLPCLKEQQKIGVFLSSINKKIELVDFQLERNKEFKKGLLQQMFV